MIDLDAIRARDAAGVYESATAAMANVHFKIAADDRRALLAYVDELLAERAELVSAGYAGVLQKRLTEAEADNARLVAANKARDEFLRGHRYKHSEVDGYIDLCESQMADLKAQLAEAEALLRVMPGYGLSAYDKERWEKARNAFLAPDSASHREDGSHG